MKRIKSTIFVSIALSTLAISIILPILAPLIRELRLSVTEGGWMISIGSMATAVTAAAWGTASDRIGRKFVMLAGFAGLGASFLLYTATIWSGLAATLSGSTLFLLLAATRALVGGFQPAVPAGAQALVWLAGLTTLLLTATIAAYYFSYALLGVGAGLLVPGYMAGASLAVPADRQGAVAGLSAAAQGIGFILGPVASTMLYEIDPSLPLWGLLGLMTLLFVLFAVRSPTVERSAPAPAP